MPYELIEKIKIEDVTSGAIGGDGTFDKLMSVVGLHIHQEWSKNRIKGTEYATVYLGALNSVLDKGMAFAMEVDKSWLEAEILRLQAEKLEIEKVKVQAEVDLTEAQIGLITQQTANAVIEGTVLEATECKLRAEFDVLMEQKLKTIAETLLLGQKNQTELAQVSGAHIAADSILGKQRDLYANQAAGFIRDAEQKAADILTKTWSVRRTTDEGTQANIENKLDDTNVGRAVQALLIGANA